MTTSRSLRAAINAAQRQPHLRDARGHIGLVREPPRKARRSSWVFAPPTDPAKVLAEAIDEVMNKGADVERAALEGRRGR